MDNARVFGDGGGGWGGWGEVGAGSEDVVRTGAIPKIHRS